MVPPETHTQPRQIRIRDELWDRLAVAAATAGVDRSTVVRELIEWYLREPNTKRAPRRPDRPTDAQLAAWRAKHPARRRAAQPTNPVPGPTTAPGATEGTGSMDSRAG